MKTKIDKSLYLRFHVAIMRYPNFAILAFLLLCQSCKSQGSQEKFVIVNTKQSGRKELSELITRINELNPKVLAINLMFKTRKEDSIDNKLAHSLRSCKNLVMLSAINNYQPRQFMHQNLIQVNRPEFTVNAHTGFADLILENNESLTVREFSLSEFVGGVEEFSFALRVAYQYDSALAVAYKLRHDNYNDIDIGLRLDDFLYLEIDDFKNGLIEKDQIEGKIVMLGFLGPGNDDRFVIPVPAETERNIYGVQLQARLVKQILENKN